MASNINDSIIFPCNVTDGLDGFYQTVLQRKNTTTKAFKDIVGEEYENYRKQLWNMAGFKVGKQKIANYNPDMIIYDKDGKIVAFEEDKGHYVDICFLKRFLSNAAEIIDHYLSNSKECPFLILSSPTTFRQYDNHYENIVRLYRGDIQEVMREKVKYLTICEHDRVSPKLYYKGKRNCFIPSKSKIDNVVGFMNHLGRRNEK